MSSTMSKRNTRSMTNSNELDQQSMSTTTNDEIIALKKAILEVKDTLEKVLENLKEQTEIIKSLRDENSSLSSKLAKFETTETASQLEEQDGRLITQGEHTTTTLDFESLPQPN